MRIFGTSSMQLLMRKLCINFRVT